MPRLEFMKHLEVIDLGDYMPEMTGQKMHTWVNPPMGMRVDYLRALKEAGLEPTGTNYSAVYEFTAQLLSQGPEDDRWTADEVRELLESSSQTDPRFWSWLVEQIITRIETHRGNIKKN